jgi:transposase
MRYELSDDEWTAIKPMLPNKPRGVPRVNDRRVLNGLFRVLRSGAPWRDLPDNFGPSYNSHRSGYGCVLMSPRPSTRRPSAERGHSSAGQ